jgi:hypothetical protein
MVHPYYVTNENCVRQLVIALKVFGDTFQGARSLMSQNNVNVLRCSLKNEYILSLFKHSNSAL